MKIILGSQSTYRRKIMEESGIPFEAMSADIDEKAIRFPNPQTLTLALAHAKADALLARITEPALLITTDQVVLHNNTILEKPESADEARSFLRTYADAPVQTIAAVVVTNTETDKRHEGIDIATTYFKSIPEETIEALIQKGDLFYCCGGFTVEDPLLKKYIEKIDGTIDSIMGLPLELTRRLLSESGAVLQ